MRIVLIIRHFGGLIAILGSDFPLFTDYGKNLPYYCLMTLLKGFLDLLYPLACEGCGINLVTDLPLCGFCAASIQSAESRIIQEQLDRLETPMPFLGLTYALWMYDKAGVVQKVHHALKYQNRPGYGIELGKLMGSRLAPLFNRSITPDVLVPIPLHRTRYLERGYNQSQMLAQGIQKTLDLPVDPSLLIRPRATTRQTGLGRKDRWDNVKQAFQCVSKLPNTPHILLIDDVFTTGATLIAAAKSLFDAGASCVSLATLAFTRP